MGDPASSAQPHMFGLNYDMKMYALLPGLYPDPFFEFLFLSGIGLAPFTQDLSNMEVPNLAYLAWYGRYLRTHPGKIVDFSSVAVASWADLMGPMISEAKIPAQDVARNLFVQAVCELVQGDVLPSLGYFTGAEYAGHADDGPRNLWNAMKAKNVQGVTPEFAMEILIEIATAGAFNIDGVGMIINVFIAVLKRGNLSMNEAYKLSKAVKHNLNITYVHVCPENCNVFYTRFGQYINDQTIRKINTLWANLLPMPVLPLWLAVKKVVGTELTALSVTGRAIKLFADFNWTRIRTMYVYEWKAFVTAVNLVEDNVWYEFKKDLEPVLGRKYKNLSYVAKQLLIQVNGETSLKHYPEWAPRPNYYTVLDAMITEYKQAKEKSTRASVTYDEVVVSLRESLRKFGNIYP